MSREIVTIDIHGFSIDVNWDSAKSLPGCHYEDTGLGGRGSLHDEAIQFCMGTKQKKMDCSASGACPCESESRLAMTG